MARITIRIYEEVIEYQCDRSIIQFVRRKWSGTKGGWNLQRIKSIDPQEAVKELRRWKEVWNYE